MQGPIDYIIVGFEGNRFDGSILRALTEAIDDGVIALVALSVVIKDKEGEVTMLDIMDIDDEYVVDYVRANATNIEAITEEDVVEVAELLDNDTAAGLLVIEQLWARPLKQALVDTGGYLIADGRIHPDAAEELANAKEV